MDLRMTVRRQADNEKINLFNKVEKMKRKGNFDKSELGRLGISIKASDDDIDEINNLEGSNLPKNFSEGYNSGLNWHR